jgi:tRNA G18 (ribose-2'-O)-methylase SpoU
MSNTSGTQLEGSVLYERQKVLRAQERFPPAPQIIATQLQVPDNIGSVLRLADAAGSSRVIFINTTEIDDKRVHKTARSCELLVAWEVYTMEQFLHEQEAFQPLIALEITSQSRTIFATKLPTRCSFVIGNERHGIPTPILSLCRQALHIPMYGTNGSMNVTHALGIALFEWRRQQSHYE